MTTGAADLEFALSLADDADAITLQRFRAVDLVVDAKPDLTPVSDADRAVESAVRARIGAERSTDGVVGEEFGAQGVSEGDTGDSTRRWIIDPIDGTKNFVRGLPVWATLIALEVGGRVEVGVVSAPALGRRWWARRGGGAWSSDRASGAAPVVRPCAVSKVGRLADAHLSYSSLSGWSERGLGPTFLGLCAAVWRTRAFGDFWSYMLLAEGSVDIACEPVVALWDLAALLVIVEEAGGAFTDLAGVARPDGGSAVASNGALHQQVLAHLAGGS